MNGIRCANCDLVNLLAAEVCHRCGSNLKNLPASAEVSVPAEQLYRAQALTPAGSSEIPLDNELGRKTHFWYRIYCGVLVVIYLLLMSIGLMLAVFQPASGNSSPEENLIVGIVYTVLGSVFALVTIIALLLPRKPYNWIVGIVMIALGMTSCCFVPAMIPLLIFWLKPETKAYFGRS